MNNTKQQRMKKTPLISCSSYSIGTSLLSASENSIFFCSELQFNVVFIARLLKTLMLYKPQFLSSTDIAFSTDRDIFNLILPLNKEMWIKYAVWTENDYVWEVSILLTMGKKKEEESWECEMYLQNHPKNRSFEIFQAVQKPNKIAEFSKMWKEISIIL